MKVLMFGWEFPPFISGGLGTASYGITQGLTNSHVEVAFVMPTKRGQKIEVPFHIIAADEIRLFKKYEHVIKKLKHVKRSIFEKKFTIAPYFTNEEYISYIRQFSNEKKFKQINIEEKGVLKFTGNYGKQLMNEVQRYGIVGEVLGHAEEFDVIHAHDWLTYYAGVAAKFASGKPLVVHVHATEIDRSGEHLNQEVYDIERFGMENADRIIAVSHFTKNIVVNRYGIHPDKVDVVHNAVDKKDVLQHLGINKVMDEKLVLFLGRVTMQKALIILWKPLIKYQGKTRMSGLSWLEAVTCLPV